ncbi:YfhO family protein [Enterococcus sp. LJL51]|uniref:YfhO family protein n=1 Tax=Enterococcus sp. LJL51 TaxID=3416656 RepID=UPI003CE6C3C4
MKILIQNRKVLAFGAASVLIPVVIMAICYYLNGIYYGSDRTVLASDALVQYANFHATMNNVLHGKQDLFYTWSGSLGLNFWALSAYYLNGLFTPLVYFFDNIHMPDALYVITLVKFGAVGGSFWFFARKTFKLSEWLYLALSVCYALMSYATAYSEVIMWLDPLVYLPLIFLGIHRLMDEKRPGLLFISYLLLFLSNFYMAFMIGVFSFLYFFCRLFTDRKRYVSRIGSYLLTSILAGLASMVTILPTILDLSSNGESLDQLSVFWQWNTGPWDLLTKSMVGVYDTSKYGSAPFIYIGLFPLLFCLWYFLSKKIPLRNKLLYGSLFVLLIASVYISPLNLFWHGLHSPNMFLYRFSFLFSFLIILLAGYGLERFEQADVDRFSTSVLVVIGLFLATYLLANRKRYGYLTPLALIFTMVYLVLYLVLWIGVQKGKRHSVMFGLLCLVMLTETGVNAYYMVVGIRSDWGYADRTAYTKNYKEIDQLVTQTKESNDQFYRMENLTGMFNDSFKYGYSGVTMFSSIRNRHSSQYLNQLGYRSNGTNLNIKYQNNTLVMDALIGIKYNLSGERISKFGFKEVGKSGTYRLYENQYALPLGMLTDEGIYKKDAVANQTELLRYLSEEENSVFKVAEIEQTKLENGVMHRNGEEVQYVRESASDPLVLHWEVEVPAKTQAYISLMPTTFDTSNRGNIRVTVGSRTLSGELISDGQYYDLGYYEEAKTVKVKASITNEESSVVRMFKPDALLLDTEKFDQMMEKIQQKSVNFKVEGRTAEATVELAEDQVILTTIPYDKGWSAYVDGKKVEIPTFKEALLTLPVEKGTHTIKFVYFPQGLKLGIGLFIGSSGVFVFYLLYLRKQKTKEN